MGLLPTKLQLLKISILGHMTSEKGKLAIISEIVRDRAKRSKFSNHMGLLPTKLQLLKILIFGSHDPSRSHDLGNVNWTLSRQQSEIEQNGANLRTLWVYYLRNNFLVMYQMSVIKHIQ